MGNQGFSMIFFTVNTLKHTILLKRITYYERSSMQDYNFDEYFERFPVGMGYVPWQHMSKIYDNLEEAFMTGTIFPELNKPFTGRRCV